MNKPRELIKKVEKGCGKKCIWSGNNYICGSMEDLKHSNHIILCDECQEKIKTYKKMQEAIIKEINKLSGRIILGNYTKEGVLNLLIELKQRIKGGN